MAALRGGRELAERRVHPRRLATVSSGLARTNRREWKALRSEGSVGEVDNGPGGSEPAPEGFAAAPEPNVSPVHTVLQR